MSQRKTLSEGELERLTALSRYDVLDTPPEAVFDDLTGLAATVCGFPISLMTLLDENRQWFKSAVGLDLRETPRCISFCTHAIQHSDIMIVPDALLDERFAKSPLVVGEPKIRFYAGVPLITPDGFRLGTLNVIDLKPREFSLGQQQILRTLANQAMSQLELRLALRKLALRTLEFNGAYADLQASEERFRIMFQQAGVGVAQIRIDTGEFIEINSKYCDILGYSAEEMERMRMEETIAPEDWKAYRTGMAALGSGQRPGFSAELRMIQKSGGLVWAAMEISPQRNAAEAFVYGITIVQDITARKQAEAELEKALERETVFNREIHHRVKNNLQVISSLLFLQQSHATDPTTVDALRESQLRTHAIALIHEKLYRSRDAAKIEFSGYARDLARDLINAYRSRGGARVDLRVEPDGILLCLDAAIPCGFILTELVTNSLKYAFPHSQRGEIVITLHPAAGGFLVLQVSDDGVGFPEGFDLEGSQTLGLKLVRDLTRQLNGRLEFIEGAGTTVRITFPELGNVG
ncbi:MAG: histidine kinase dimerization/phosphoacceptor domain -containing protein [Verrucomicrobiota bacterium]